MFKNQKKSHSTLRAKRASLTFQVDKKFIKNAKNGQFWRVFKKPDTCGQTVSPDRGQELRENAKIEKSKCDILSHFQTL